MGGGGWGSIGVELSTRTTIPKEKQNEEYIKKSDSVK